MAIVFTAEEVECIRDQMSSRVEEMEWQLRRELATLREVEGRMMAILADINGPGGTASIAKPALASLAGRMPRRMPPPPPPLPRRLGSTVPVPIATRGADGTPPKGTKSH